MAPVMVAHDAQLPHASAFNGPTFVASTLQSRLQLLHCDQCVYGSMSMGAAG